MLAVTRKPRFVAGCAGGTKRMLLLIVLTLAKISMESRHSKMTKGRDDSHGRRSVGRRHLVCTSSPLQYPAGAATWATQ